MAEQTGQPSNIDNLPHGKAAKELAKLYDKDPRDVMPDIWFEDKQASPEQQIAEQPLFVGPQGAPVAGGPAQAVPPPQGGFTPPATTPPEQPQSMAQKIMSRISAPFRKV